MLAGDKQIFIDGSYQDLLVESNDIMTMLRTEIFAKIDGTFRGIIYTSLTPITDHIARYEKHIIAALIVLVIVVSFSFLKMGVLVMQNRDNPKHKQSAKAKRAYFFLLPVALLINFTSAGVEGIATFVLLRDIKVKGRRHVLTCLIKDRLVFVNDVEVILQNEAYNILIQDAALTGSASRFELTGGDTFWLDRYMENIPALDTAIDVSRELSQVSPNPFTQKTTQDLEIYDIIDSVNDILISQEDIALGDPASGLFALYGNEYLSNKNVYNYAAAKYVEIQTSRIDGIFFCFLPLC